MFIVNEGIVFLKVTKDTRLSWFTNDELEDSKTFQEYKLIGILIGLSIYNGIILNINFPLALYKKLFNKLCTLEDLIELDPVYIIHIFQQLGSGLKQLLEFEGNVEETFQQTFRIKRTTISGYSEHDLIENGEHINVNKLNRSGKLFLFTRICFSLCRFLF